MDTKKLRQKLLDLAIRGKLVPQDSNDEPASELLSRIHEEKLTMVERGELKPKDVKNDTVIYFGSDGLPIGTSEITMSPVTSFGLKCTVSSVGQSLIGWMFGSRCLYAGSDGGANCVFGRLTLATV